MYRREKEITDQYRLIVTVILVFIIGCTAGWIYEMAFYRIDLGHFVKRGQGMGPWLPIYGVGALAITALFYERHTSPGIVFLGSTLTSGIIEFATGWGLFHFGNGLRLWDYNVEIWNWGNIGGYVCLRSVLLFGLCGLFVVYVLLPAISRLVSGVRREFLTPVVMLLAAVFVIDIIFGYFIRPFAGLNFSFGFLSF